MAVEAPTIAANNEGGQVVAAVNQRLNVDELLVQK